MDINTNIFTTDRDLIKRYRTRAIKQHEKKTIENFACAKNEIKYNCGNPRIESPITNACPNPSLNAPSKCGDNVEMNIKQYTIGNACRFIVIKNKRAKIRFIKTNGNCG